MRFFALEGKGSTLSAGAMTRSLHHCLAMLGAGSSPGGKFTLHSLQIGAHSEQVLVGIPIEVVLSRFRRGPRTDEMAALYFDSTIRVSSASFWIFGTGSPPASHVPAVTAVSPPVGGPSS